MSAVELSRTPGPPGYTTITVALGADRQGTITVPTHLVDGPGYRDMLDLYVAKHFDLVKLREGQAIE